MEREILTRMFEADLELARDFNRVGELQCAQAHLEAAGEKLSQIAALEVDRPALRNDVASQREATHQLKNITP